MKTTTILKKFLSAFLAICLIFTVFPPGEVKGASLMEELEEIEKQIEEYKDNIEDQVALATALQKEIELLDKQITQVEEEIESLNEQIAATEKRLEAAKISLKEAEIEKERYRQQLEERITVMYMYGDVGYLEVLFGAKGFSDLISRATAIASIIEHDNTVAQKLKETEALVSAMTKLIEEEKVKLEKLKSQKLAREDELTGQKNSKSESLKKIKETEAYWKALAKAEEAEATAIRKEIAAQNSNTDYANTYKTFVWPTPGYYSITSPYGYRIHPIYNVRKFHSGFDIGAPRNAPIVAIANGKVIRASWYGGYGNCVVVDLGKDSQGNTYKVLYAHLNKYAVSNGDIVTQGQVVGYVGTTGTSTGNHLHCEIHINGATVNPVNYLSK
ncbi:MAG: peptidoglycan DD-metalloendopeptidase family protein [Eubacteriaceae bacterium]|nr:peptidoglycan DD-metalloendopeptidase family protein [Eubacteriaceae bacterium]